MKRFWNKNKGMVLAAGVVFFLCIFLIIKNCTHPDFFIADLTDIITIIVRVIIAGFITERLTDQRRRNDCIEHIIMEIESTITEENNFYSDDRSILSKHTSCANRIKYLKDASFSDVQTDIEFIESHFEEIRNLYSEHKDNLQGVKPDIDRHRDYIIDKCNKIRIGLYNDL